MATSMSSTVLVVLGGALAGGFVSGLAGFGTSLVALGFWLHVVSPAAATTLAAICSVIGQVQTLPAIWPSIDRRRIWPMLLAGLLGVPIGTAFLAQVDPHQFRRVVGVLLLLFSGFLLLGRFQPRVALANPLADRAADGVIGFAGGVLGGLAGLSGPLPVLWAALRGWSKEQRRGVFQAFNTTILFATVLAHAATGLVDAEMGWLVLLALPGTVAGTWLGLAAYRRLSDRRFHEVVLGLLAFSGATLVWSSF